MSFFFMCVSVGQGWIKMNLKTGPRLYSTCKGLSKFGEAEDDDHSLAQAQALKFRTPLFPYLVPPAIMVWIFVWKYIFEPFIHILQHL